jgi:hypothetical protein
MEDTFQAADLRWVPDAEIDQLHRWSELLLERGGAPEQATVEEARRALATARRMDRHGHTALAEGLARRAFEGLRARLGGHHEETLTALRLALQIVLNQDLDRWEELVAGYEALLELERAAHGEESVRTLETRLLLVTARMAGGDLGLAEQELRRCHDIADAQEHPPAQSPYYFFLVAQLAALHGRARHAREFEAQALQLLEGAAALSLLDALTLVGIAQVHLASWRESAGGELEHARSCLRRVAELDARGAPELAVQQAFALRTLGAAADREGRGDEARRLLGEAVEVVERALGPLHLEVAYAHRDLGLHDLEAGDHERAARHLGRAVEIVAARRAAGPIPEALEGCEADHRRALEGLREAEAAQRGWLELELELEATIERAGGAKAIERRDDHQDLDDLEGRYLTACLAAHRGQPARALDELLVVLRGARGPESQRAAALARRILRLCGTGDPDVNRRRRSLLPWL